MNTCGNSTAILEPHEVWITLVWTEVLGFISFFCNVIAIFAILRICDLRKKGSTKVTLSYLASSTLNALAMMIGILLMHMDQARPSEERLSPYIWNNIKAFSYLFDSIHMYNMAVLSVTRLIAMFRPVLFQQLMAPRSIVAMLSITWGLPAIMTLPLYLGVVGKVDSETFDYIRDCDQFPVAEVVYLIFIFMIPGITPLVIYVIMFVQVSRARKAIETSPASPENERKISQWNSDITRAIFVNVMAHFIFWVPHEVYHIVAVFHGNILAYVIIHALGAIRYVLDPVIFMVFAQNYRQAGISLLHFICKKNEGQTEVSNFCKPSPLVTRV